MLIPLHSSKLRDLRDRFYEQRSGWYAAPHHQFVTCNKELRARGRLVSILCEVKISNQHPSGDIA